MWALGGLVFWSIVGVSLGVAPCRDKLGLRRKLKNLHAKSRTWHVDFGASCAAQDYCKQGATPALTPITLKPVYQPDLY